MLQSNKRKGGQPRHPLEGGDRAIEAVHNPVFIEHAGDYLSMRPPQELLYECEVGQAKQRSKGLLRCEYDNIQIA